MTYTYTSYAEFGAGELPEIPSSIKEQNELLERAVYDLFNMLMEELNWDNPVDIADRLADEVNRIAMRAWERNAEYDENEKW